MTDPNKLLPSPYHEMLEALASTKGYADFKNFVHSRFTARPDDIKAEIKAIFELHCSGFLTRICSNEESAPEAEISIHANGHDYQGIVEVAFVNYRFDTIDDTKALINRTLNVKKGTNLNKSFPDEKIWIRKTENGTLIVGENANLSVKIPKLYETKRKQHSKRYQDYNTNDKSGYIKVYYFVVDAPPTQIAQFYASYRIMNKLKPGEILVLTSIHGADKHSRITIVRGMELEFELDNPYFSTQ
ncbi:MAG TPA: hypothetical protein PKA02_00985 [Candidatus Saccharibacteria bacterium]|nr:hypothetical protein [Candidatus Saccharibacteria bacterium]